MSKEENKTKEKLFNKEQSFLGKKTESPNSFINLFEISNISNNECKILQNKNNLIKCSKCTNNFCFECIQQITHKNVNKLKENEFICTNCLNIEEKKKNEEMPCRICYICRKRFQEKNLIIYNVNQEQNNEFKIIFLNKNLSLDEKEEDLINNENLNSTIQLCKICFYQNKDIIENILGTKNHKNEKSQNTVDKEKLEDKGKNSNLNNLNITNENNLNINLKENKIELMNDNIVQKKEIQKEEVNTNEYNNKEKIINIKNEDEIKNNIFIDNINKLDFQNIIGNNLLLKNLNN